MRMPGVLYYTGGGVAAPAGIPAERESGNDIRRNGPENYSVGSGSYGSCREAVSYTHLDVYKREYHRGA